MGDPKQSNRAVAAEQADYRKRMGAIRREHNIVSETRHWIPHHFSHSGDARRWVFAAILLGCTVVAIGYQWWLNSLKGAQNYPNSAQLATALFAGAAFL